MPHRLIAHGKRERVAFVRLFNGLIVAPEKPRRIRNKRHGLPIRPIRGIYLQFCPG